MKSQTVNVRLNEKEERLLSAMCTKTGMNKSELLKSALYDDHLDNKVCIYKSLSRISTIMAKYDDKDQDARKVREEIMKICRSLNS